MFDWINWFRSQLKTSADGLVWGFSRIDPARHFALPPFPRALGTWPPARHIWHVTQYERDVALPSMHQWLGAPMPAFDHLPDEDVQWPTLTGQLSFSGLIEAFRDVRRDQIDLLDQLTGVDWETPRATEWGHKSLSWVVSKTYQHTFEHGDTLMQMALWWDDFEQMLAAQGGA